MKSIYVGNLAHSTSEDDLRQAFAQYGTVSAVKIVTDRETGRPRGFAFVEMADDNEAASAIKELNLREIAGRSITVNEARPKTERPRRGGGMRRWYRPPSGTIVARATVGHDFLVPHLFFPARATPPQPLRLLTLARTPARA